MSSPACRKKDFAEASNKQDRDLRVTGEGGPRAQGGGGRNGERQGISGDTRSAQQGQGAHVTETNEIQQPGNNQRRTRPEKPDCSEGKVLVSERGESTVNNAEHKQGPGEHLIQTFHAAQNSTRMAPSEASEARLLSQNPDFTHYRIGGRTGTSPAR